MSEVRYEKVSLSKLGILGLVEMISSIKVYFSSTSTQFSRLTMPKSVDARLVDLFMNSRGVHCSAFFRSPTACWGSYDVPLHTFVLIPCVI